MRRESRLRAVYILSASNAIFTMGYGMYGYIFPKFLITVNATPPQVGLVFTLISITMALMLLPGGILSDRGHRRKVVIASWVIPIFAPLFFILADLTTSWLYALPGVVVFGASWIGVAGVQSYTSEAAPVGKRGLSFGILISSGSIGLIVSPLIGGFVVEAYGFSILFMITFVLYVASTMIVLAIPRLPGDFSKKNDTYSQVSSATWKTGDTKGTRRTMSKDPSFRAGEGMDSKSSVLRRLSPLVALSCLLLGIVYIGWSYVPLYLSGEYGFDYFSVQVMYAISNLASAVIVSLMGRISDGYSLANKLALIIIPVVSLVAGYWILVPMGNVTLLPFGFVLLGSVGAVFPLVYSIVGELSAGRRVGQTYGVVGTFIYAAEATTPYLGGVLYSNMPQLPFTLTLFLSPLLVMAVLIAYARIR
jgi:MFS family permease